MNVEQQIIAQLNKNTANIKLIIKQLNRNTAAIKALSMVEVPATTEPVAEKPVTAEVKP